MKIIRETQGQKIAQEIIKIKDYPRYALYQVNKIENGKRIPLYKQCFTNLELQEIIRKGNCINEEVTHDEE